MSKLAEIAEVNSVSRISEGASIVGDITSSNDIRIDGRVKGKITSEGRIVIGEHAVVEGTLMCANLDLWGKVEGEIFVKELLSLKASASVKGNLSMRKFHVEIGAVLDGVCKMIDAESLDARIDSAVSETAQVE